MNFITENAIVIVVVLGVLTIYYWVSTLIGGARMSNRLKSVASRREELRKRHQQRVSEGKGLRREIGAGDWIQNLVSKFDLQKLAEDPEINKKMLRAGIYGQRPVSVYYFCRIMVPLLSGTGVWGYLRFVGDFDFSSQNILLAVTVVAVVGYYIPSVYIDMRISRRRRAIMKVFPDALDMLLVCVEAGTTIEQAMSYVAERIAVGSPELGAELALTNAEMSYLPERRQAYQNLAMRNDHPGVRSVATALIQADRYGTAVGDALRVMAKENRELRMLQVEQQASALPAKMTLPMVIFFLPVLFVVVLGPIVIRFMEDSIF